MYSIEEVRMTDPEIAAAIEKPPATLAPGPEAKGRRQRCDPIGGSINVARLVVELVRVCLLGVRDC